MFIKFRRYGRKGLWDNEIFINCDKIIAITDGEPDERGREQGTYIYTGCCDYDYFHVDEDIETVIRRVGDAQKL